MAQEFNNPYEETKARAEAIVREWSSNSGIASIIYRLPIVLGDSLTGKTSSFSGFYAFFKAFWKLKKILIEKIGGDLQGANTGIKFEDGEVYIPLYIPCKASSRIDLVPIDWLTRTILAISDKLTAKDKTLHLSHPNPPSSLTVIKAAMSIMGLKGLLYSANGCMDPERIHQASLLKRLQRMVDSTTNRYFSYATSNKIFDNSNLKAILGHEYLPPPVNKSMIEKMLNYAISNNFKRPCFV